MKIKNILVIVSLTIMLTACGSSLYYPYNAPRKDFKEVTTLELKTIQTRRFKAAPADVQKVINQSCLDKDGQTTIPSSGSLYNGACAWSFQGVMYDPAIREVRRLNYIVQYDVNIDPKEAKASIVRLRIYFTKNTYRNDEPQVTNPEYYKREFKVLADALFMEAIELNPQDME